MSNGGWFIEERADYAPYFDGDTLDDSGPGYDYLWTGAPNASTSTATTLVSTPADVYNYLFPAQVPKPDGDLSTHRTTTVLYDLLNTDDELLGPLVPVLDAEGTLTFDVDGRIKGGGSIGVADDGSKIDWVWWPPLLVRGIARQVGGARPGLHHRGVGVQGWG
jgi:hypothetical protein